MSTNQVSTIRMRLLAGESLYAMVEFAHGSGNDCLLDLEQEPMVHIAEEDGTIFAEGFGRQDVRLNGEPLMLRKRLRDGDVLDVAQTTLTVHIEGDKLPPVRSRPWVFVGVGLLAVAVLLFAWLKWGGQDQPVADAPVVTEIPSQAPVLPSFRETEIVDEPRVEIPRREATPKSTPVSDPHEELVRVDLGISLGCVAVSPGGRIMAVGTGDGSVRLLDPITGKETRSLRGHEDSVAAIVFSNNGKHLLTGGYDGVLRWWDVESGAVVYQMKGHTGPVRTVAISTDGKRALSGGVEGTVVFWDLETGEELDWFFGHVGMVNAVAFTPDGKRGLSGGVDATVRIWELATGKEINRLTGDLTGVNALAISPDGKKLVTGGDGFRVGPVDVSFTDVNTIRQWEIVRGTEIEIPTQTRDWITALRYSPNGKHVAACTGGDPSSGGLRPELPPLVRLYSVTEWKETAAWEGHAQVISGIDFFPDNERLVSVGLDGTVRIWAVPR